MLRRTPRSKRTETLLSHRTRFRAVTAIGVVTDRAERALAIEANRLLGGDAVVRGDQPIAGLLREAARAPGLAHTETVEFSSMIRAGEGRDAALRLGELRALGDRFPPRGRFLVYAHRGPRDAHGTPAPRTRGITPEKVAQGQN